MKPKTQISLFGLAVFAHAVWQTRGLPTHWLHSPFDRMGWLAALVWIGAIIVAWRGTRHSPTLAWLGLSLVLGLAGTVSDLNVLRYAGLAAAGAAFFRGLPAALASWVCALCWMPVLGYVCKEFGTPFVNTLRVTMAVAAGFAACLFARAR